MNGNEKAFPSESVDGMDLRDYFAAKAMNGCLSYSYTRQFQEYVSIDELSKHCYQIADAMMEARKQQPNG